MNRHREELASRILRALHATGQIKHEDIPEADKNAQPALGRVMVQGRRSLAEALSFVLKAKGGLTEKAYNEFLGIFAKFENGYFNRCATCIEVCGFLLSWGQRSLLLEFIKSWLPIGTVIDLSYGGVDNILEIAQQLRGQLGE